MGNHDIYLGSQTYMLPIRTAPKGARILLWHPELEAWVIGYWGRCATLPYTTSNPYGLETSGWLYGDDPETAVLFEPTFWAPLPVSVGNQR